MPFPNLQDSSGIDLLTYQLAQQQQQQDLANNPFYAGGNALLAQPAPRIGDRKGSFLGSFLPAFLQPTLGGFARGFGQGQVENAYTNPETGYLGLLSKAQSASPEDLQTIYSANPSFQKKFGAEVGLINKLKKSEQDEEFEKLNNQFVQAQIKAVGENPYAAQRIAGLELKRKADGSIVLEPKEATPEILPIVQEEQPKSIFGQESLSSKERKRFQEGLQAGLKPDQSAITARASTEAERKLILPQYKKLQDEEDLIGGLERQKQLTEEGIAKAGVTGSRTASLYEKGLSGLSSYLGGGVFPEAERQAAGDSALAQAQQLAVAANRIKGTGALSDFETRGLLSTAPGPDKTPAQNQEILQNITIALEAAKEHNDFINTAASEGVTPHKAQILWNAYKKENPIIVTDFNGGIKLNENRIPWQQVNFPELEQKFLSGNLGKGTQQSSQQQIEAPRMRKIRNAQTGEILKIPR